MNNYTAIKNLADIDTFIKKTNALHDGYVIAVEYLNKGIKPTVLDSELYTGWGYEFNWALTRLKIRVLITSIQDAVLEMVFEHVIKWKITEEQYDILEAGVRFDDNGFVIWTDDAEGMENVKETDSYVIAEKMKWRIL